MNFHEATVDMQYAALHTVSAGLTVTSIAGALGYIPVIVAVCAGLAAVVSYTFSTLDSPSFQRRIANWTMRHKMRKIAKLRRQQIVLTAKLQALDTIERAHEHAQQIIADGAKGVLTSSPPALSLPVAGASGPKGIH